MEEEELVDQALAVEEVDLADQASVLEEVGPVLVDQALEVEDWDPALVDQHSGVLVVVLVDLDQVSAVED